MDLNHDELLDLCAGHALGCLDEADRRALEAHLAGGCVECERAIADYGEATLAVAAGVAPVRPGPALKRSVLMAIAAEPDALRTSQASGARGRPVWKVVAGFGWAAAAALAVAFMMQQRTVVEIAGQLDALRDAQTQLTRDLEEERLWNAAMASPAARVGFFAPASGEAPKPSGWVVYDPSSRRAVVVLEHLRAEAGQDFELWAIRAGGPRSLGVIATDPSGRALLRLADVDDPETLAAFAVSLEATGGSPDPTKPSGPVVLVGSL